MLPDPERAAIRAALGMHSLNGDLARLVDAGQITKEAALKCSADKRDLEQYF